MNRIGIFGTSGMAREAGDIAWDIGLEPIYVARDRADMDACSLTGHVILESDVDSCRHIDYVIGIGNNSIRQKIAQRFSARLRFTNLIHSSASFGTGQREILAAKQGVIICAGVRLTSNIQVGNFCIFNLNSTISHDVIIDDFAYLAPGVHVTGNVHIAERTWIGAGVTINQGTDSQKRYIGADTTIGSGTVVVSDCVSGAVYVGNPARRIK